MKNQSLIIATVQPDAALESKIKKTEERTDELPKKMAIHFAGRNLPAPQNDNLAHYTGELRTDCEKLATELHQYLQPSAGFPEAKVDADYFREKDGELELRITTLNDQNHNDRLQLHDFNPGAIATRIRWAAIVNLVIMIGEIIFNTKAFQVTGENLLFALILSISVSLSVFIFSHMVAFLYKEAKTKWRKRFIVICSLCIVTVLFIALAIFRSTYLATHDVHIDPVYFVIINLFFFIVSTLLSYFVLPTWQELRDNAKMLKIHYDIKKREKEVKTLKNEREEIRKTIAERTKVRIRIAHLTNYAAERIRKIYWHSVEIFKTTNLSYRTDRITPECFSEMLPEPDIHDVVFTMLNSNHNLK